jgi:hypothetical protein
VFHAASSLLKDLLIGMALVSCRRLFVSRFDDIRGSHDE